MTDRPELNEAGPANTDPAGPQTVENRTAAEALSARQGRIETLGQLADDSLLDMWNEQGISRQRRQMAGEISAAELAAAQERLRVSYVPVTPGAPFRCVDGSHRRNDNDTAVQTSAGLGPQIQGGTGDQAFAYRLMAGELPSSANLLDDMATVATRPNRFAAGDHTDDHADAAKSGCGAVDGQQRKLDKFLDPAMAEVIKAKTAALLEPAGMLGADRYDDWFDQLQIAARRLRAQPAYFPSALRFLDKLHELNPAGVECLVRPHNEVSLTVNYVPDTTFDRDTFNAATDSRIQNFGLDAWAVVREREPAEAYALMADAVATVMDLTDGSLVLNIRLPAA